MVLANFLYIVYIASIITSGQGNRSVNDRKMTGNRHAVVDRRDKSMTQEYVEKEVHYAGT